MKIASIAKIAKDVIIAVFAKKNAKIATSVLDVKNVVV